MSSRVDRIVECSAGHLFTTLWVPLASFKAVRFDGSGRRFQRCPVGRHWAMVHLVDPAALTAAQRDTALSIHDIHII